MSKLKQLVKARRAEREASARGRVTMGRWTVDYTEYDPAVFPDRAAEAPRWYASVFLTGTHGAHCFGGESRQEVEEKVRRYITPTEIKLNPIDVGFDLRETRTPVAVPFSGEITIHLPRSNRHPNGRTIGPLTSGWARAELRQAGYMVSDQ